MAESNDITESEELFNQEVEVIVEEIKEANDDSSISELEKNRRITELLREIEEYTQPLIQQIDNLSNNQRDAILYRMARLFPEIIQREIKSVAKLKCKKQPQRQQTANHESIQTTIIQLF